MKRLREEIPAGDADAQQAADAAAAMPRHRPDAFMRDRVRQRIVSGHPAPPAPRVVRPQLVAAAGAVVGAVGVLLFVPSLHRDHQTPAPVVAPHAASGAVTPSAPAPSPPVPGAPVPGAPAPVPAAANTLAAPTAITPAAEGSPAHHATAPATAHDTAPTHRAAAPPVTPPAPTAAAEPQPPAATDETAAPDSPGEAALADAAARRRAAEEGALVTAAYRALRHAHDAQDALDRLDEYSRLYPGGMLEEEVQALRIEALLELGNPRARTLALAYLRAHPLGRFRAVAIRARDFDFEKVSAP